MKKHTKEQLLQKLSTHQLNESETIEFKEQWRQDNGKSLSAFGNGENGGWLIVGIDDKGRLLGKELHWAKKQKDFIERHIMGYLEPQVAANSILTRIYSRKQLYHY